jgi:hypothetical protein
MYARGRTRTLAHRLREIWRQVSEVSAVGRQGAFMSAIALLAEAAAAGVSLRLEPAGTVHLTATTPPSAELLAGLREHRREIVALLRGDACRYCGGPIRWSEPGGLVFDDGRGAHVHCYDRVETARQAATRAKRQPKEQAA